MENISLYQPLIEYGRSIGIELKDEQLEQFDKYRILLKEWNEKINLTAITEDEEIVIKHFVDSLTILDILKKNNIKTLADIGTGAGFPGVPLKIAFPELKVTLVDSLDKRLNFLNEVINSLGLKDIKTVHGRAEDFGRDPKYRDKFDATTARAVAAMPVLLEYCMPPVKKGGIFIAMKGSKDEGDFKNATRLLSGKLMNKISFTLDGAGELAERNIYIFNKIGVTDKAYPRKAGTPSKKPL